MLRVLVLVLLIPAACRENARPAPLELATHPSIALPVADMARPFVSPALVLRLPADGGLLPAVRLPEGESIAVSSHDERRRVITDEAKRAGYETEAPEPSKLDVVLLADAEVPWRETQRVLQLCADPANRAPRIWLAARRGDGTVGALPWFLPCTTSCGCGRPRPTVLPVEHDLSITRRQENREDFTPSELGNWYHRIFAAADGKPVIIRLTSEDEAPTALLIAVVNEARRFGVRVYATNWNRTPNGTGDWGFYSSTAPGESSTDRPRHRPGVAIVGDPTACPTEIDWFVSEEEPIEDIPPVEEIPPVEFEDE